MKPVDDITYCFFDNFDKPTIVENHENFRYIVSSSVISVPELDLFREKCGLFSQIDNFSIRIKIGTEDPIYFYKSESNYHAFLELLRERLEYKDKDESIQYEIEIQKIKKDNCILIYHFESFLQYLKELDIHGSLFLFQKLLGSDDFIQFTILHSKDPIHIETNSITFTSNDIKSNRQNMSLRKGIKEKALNSTNFDFGVSYYFIPQDFFILHGRLNTPEITELFDKICNLLSIGFIFDIFTYSIKARKIFTKLNGYKSFIFNINASDIGSNKHSTYYHIYNWIYTEGSVSDKIGLARNLISLHFKEGKSILVEPNLLNSIYSSYRIYLKDNVKQYIDIRNKMSEQLLKFSDKANSITNNFAGNFKKSIMTFVGFFTSIIIVNILKTDDLKAGISWEATVISLAFLLVALIYLLFSRWEVSNEKERFEEGYKNLKERYKDLLDPKDVERILNDDKEYKSSLKHVDNIKKIYSIMWITLLAIFTISVLYLGKLVF